MQANNQAVEDKKTIDLEHEINYNQVEELRFLLNNDNHFSLLTNYINKHKVNDNTVNYLLDNNEFTQYFKIGFKFSTIVNRIKFDKELFVAKYKLQNTFTDAYFGMVRSDLKLRNEIEQLKAQNQELLKTQSEANASKFTEIQKKYLSEENSFNIYINSERKLNNISHELLEAFEFEIYLKTCEELNHFLHLYQGKYKNPKTIINMLIIMFNDGYVSMDHIIDFVKYNKVDFKSLAQYYINPKFFTEDYTVVINRVKELFKSQCESWFIKDFDFAKSNYLSKPCVQNENENKNSKAESDDEFVKIFND